MTRAAAVPDERAVTVPLDDVTLAGLVAIRRSPAASSSSPMAAGADA